MTDEQRTQFKVLCRDIQEHPIRMDKQPHRTEGVYVWCDEWEIMEICKLFFNGPETYAADPPPNRLRTNPMFSKVSIAEQAKALSERHQDDAETILQALKTRRASYG